MRDEHLAFDDANFAAVGERLEGPVLEHVEFAIRYHAHERLEGADLVHAARDASRACCRP